MLIDALPVMLLLQEPQVLQPPSYFLPVIVILFFASFLAWLVAVVLGFSRVRAYGSSAKWFALAAMCMVLWLLQFVLIGVVLVKPEQNTELFFVTGAFLPLLFGLAGVCMIMGFVRMTDTEAILD